MEKNVCIKLSDSGLGDKLLDIIGFYVICKCLNHSPKIIFNNSSCIRAWGIINYDLELFDFSGFELIENECEYYIKSTNSSSSLSPYKGFEFVQSVLPNITFKEYSEYFNTYAKEIIKPSVNVILPENLENTYGIHLRKTDKVGNHGNPNHISTQDEFNTIMNELLKDVEIIIQQENEPQFVLVSEDNNWKNEIANRIRNIPTNKSVKMVNIEYNSNGHFNNYNEVVDMFSLSKCKEILQGVKYSTFSVVASILGNNKIRNYSRYLPTNDISLIYSYNSVVEVNGLKNFNIEKHKKITQGIRPLETNIL